MNILDSSVLSYKPHVIVKYSSDDLGSCLDGVRFEGPKFHLNIIRHPYKCRLLGSCGASAILSIGFRGRRSKAPTEQARHPAHRTGTTPCPQTRHDTLAAAMRLASFPRNVGPYGSRIPSDTGKPDSVECVLQFSRIHTTYRRHNYTSPDR